MRTEAPVLLRIAEEANVLFGSQIPDEFGYNQIIISPGHSELIDYYLVEDQENWRFI